MNFLFFEKLNDDAIVPYKTSANSAGYQLFSAYDYNIGINKSQLVLTDIKVCLPSNCVGKIEINSYLSLKHSLNIISGIIDNDFNGNVSFLIYNHGNKDFKINKGDNIATLLVEKIKNNVEVFEIIRNKQVSDEKILENGHDVIDRIGCVDKNCKTCDTICKNVKT